MRILGSFALITLDLPAARERLDAQLRDIMFTATREWVRTVVRIVPTWSGASQSSIQPIADLVGVPVFSTPVDGAPDRRDPSKGQAELVLDGPRKYFRWNTSVFHFIYNENNNANAVGFRLKRPGPYYSQRQAKAAFDAVLARRLRTLRSPVAASAVKVTQRIIGSS